MQLLKHDLEKLKAVVDDIQQNNRRPKFTQLAERLFHAGEVSAMLARPAVLLPGSWVTSNTWLCCSVTKQQLHMHIQTLGLAYRLCMLTCIVLTCTLLLKSIYSSKHHTNVCVFSQVKIHGLFRSTA